MGYHNNEETTQKAVKDAQKFINDRERIRYLAECLLGYIGYSHEAADRIIESARACDFTEIKSNHAGKMLTKCPECGLVEVEPDSFYGGNASGSECPKCEDYLTGVTLKW